MVDRKTEPLALLVDRLQTPIGELLIVADRDGNLRTIDWNIYGRLDRLFVKLFEQGLEHVQERCPVQARALTQHERFRQGFAKRCARRNGDPPTSQAASVRGLAPTPPPLQSADDDLLPSRCRVIRTYSAGQPSSQ